MMFKKHHSKLVMMIAVLAILAQGFTACNSKPKKAEDEKSAEKTEKFIGLQLYSVRGDMEKDAVATMKAVGEMGYKFIEAASYGDGKIYGMTPADFKALCEESGLEFLGAHTGQDVPSEENWDTTMSWWDDCIAAHKAAGAKWIVQPWMGGTGYESLEGLKRYCEYFNAVGEKCNAAGIRFGYHNHDKEFTTEFEGKPLYDWMLELTDPDKVMFEMDLYWIEHGGKNPTDYFEKYPGRFYLWHIKDEKEVGASGEMDFASIFAEREKAGAKYGVVEVEAYNFEPLVSVEKSLEFLNEQDYVDL